MTDLRQVVARAVAKGKDPYTTDYNTADRVLSALSASIGEDVVAAAQDAAFNALVAGGFHMPEEVLADHAKLASDAAAPIIALAARDAALEEAAKIAGGFDNCGTDIDPWHIIPSEIADAIRALKSGGRDHG